MATILYRADTHTCPVPVQPSPLPPTQVKSHACHVTLLLSQWWPGNGQTKRGRERERCRGYGREGVEEGEGERESHDHAALNQNHYPFTHSFSPARAKPTQRGLDTRLVRTLLHILRWLYNTVWVHTLGGWEGVMEDAQPCSRGACALT